MIATWKDFLIAVERMRETQKLYFLTRTPTALNAAKKREAEVDACIKAKRAEWERRQQPEFFQEEKQ